MIELPAALTAAFPPSADLLLERARQQTDDAMLMEIARADYGFMADELIVDLRRIRDEGIGSVLMYWQLHEVLSLIRFCNREVPNAPPFEPGPTGRRGHQTRLFACAVLLRLAAAHDEAIDTSPDSTLAQCIASAKVLGDEMSNGVASFLTWWITRPEGCSELLCCALGLLVLATRLRSGRITEPVLGTLAEWVLDQKSLERRQLSLNPADPMPVPFSVQAGFWLPLAAELMNETQAVRDEHVRTNLHLCEILLSSG
jgi:hypothetical protein